jgi:gamma-glutamyltranspeptidase/glutathione hydrolase
MELSVPVVPRVAARGMVVAADQLAASAGVTLLQAGGSAADAAVGAAAVMAVTSPHTGGMGGDVLAVVVPPGAPPAALLGVGRAGSGADPGALRAGGHKVMPLHGDYATVPVPGAVDGWLALHERYGRLPLEAVLAPATGLAEDGFVASALLVLASNLVAGLPFAGELCPGGPLRPQQVVRLPGVARTLRAVAARGRDGFYAGEAAAALLELGAGQYAPDDFRRPLADWVVPLRLRAFGHDLWTVPPPSQGYLTLAGAHVAEMVGLPPGPGGPQEAGWVHLLVESARAVGRDRPEVLHEGADGPALVSPERLAAAASRIRPDRAAPPGVGPPASPGDTTHLCAVDAGGLGVSLTQSNALGFGSHLVAGTTGIFLHNRGVGFSLVPGHPAELGPGRRPPHTLSPAAATRPDGSLAVLLGTMGGDAQPQILLQLLARMLVAGEGPAEAVAAPRFALDAPAAGPFRLWHGSDLRVKVEQTAPPAWRPGLEERGHVVDTVLPMTPAVGFAQVISARGAGADRVVAGGPDPRCPEGGAVGW